MDILDQLPFEIIEIILGRLSSSDLIHCSFVSKSWRSLVNNDVFWKPICMALNWGPEMPLKNGDSFNEQTTEETTCDELEPLCEWRKVYNWYSKLSGKWKTNQSVQFELTKADSPVFSMDCDGKMLVSGHQNGSISIWDIRSIPQLKQMLTAAIPDLPVTAIKTNGEVIVAAQKRLVGTFKQKRNMFRLYNATSLDISENTKVNDVIDSLGDNFPLWYTENLRFKEVYYPWKLQIILHDKKVYTLDQSRLYIGDIETSEWSCYKHENENLCDILVFKGKIYAVSQKTHTYVSCVSSDFKPAFHVLGSKTIMVSGDYFIGTSKTEDGYLRKIWVWDEENNFASVSKTIQPGSTSAASPRKGIVLYTVSRQIVVWDVIADSILNVIYEGLVSFIKPAFTNYLLILSHRVLFICDWVNGQNLYVMDTNLDWTGDFKNLLWLNHDTIVVGGSHSQLKLISYR